VGAAVSCRWGGVAVDALLTGTTGVCTSNNLQKKNSQNGIRQTTEGERTCRSRPRIHTHLAPLLTTSCPPPPALLAFGHDRGPGVCFMLRVVVVVVVVVVWSGKS
jgi:hypothetical protein